MSICFPLVAPVTVLVRDLIEATPELRPVIHQARRLAQLNKELRAALPPELAGSVSAASLTTGTLLLVADSGAAAAKVRHLGPKLCQALRHHAADLTSIEVRVQVTNRVKPLPIKQKTVSRAARTAFRALAGRLPPSPLQWAALRFSSHEDPALDAQQEAFKHQKTPKISSR
jgi:hypothetical protein